MSDIEARLRTWLCPVWGKTFRCVFIVGPPESGKTTTAVSLAEWVRDFYAERGEECTIKFLDEDARIPADWKVSTLEEAVEAVEACRTPVMVLSVTDPGLTLTFLGGGRKERQALSAFIDHMWRARHLNKNVNHFLLLLGCQSISGVTHKLRSLSVVYIIKAAGPEEYDALRKIGLKKAIGYVAALTERVMVDGDKSIAIVVFPTMPWGFVRFRYPKTFRETAEGEPRPRAAQCSHPPPPPRREERVIQGFKRV